MKSIKKCPSCGFENQEDICLQCGMVMEKKCDNCGQAQGNCVCVQKIKKFSPKQEDKI